MWPLAGSDTPDDSHDPPDTAASIQQFWDQAPWGAVGLGVSAVGLGAAGFWGLSRALRRVKRINHAGELTHDHFARRRGWIKGVVTSVGDADGFRIYHTPFPSFLRGPPAAEPTRRLETISVRLAGVDAPELPHFGHPGQPFAVEAQDHLRKLVDGRKIWVQMLKRDRFNRCVGAALYPSYFFWWRSVQQELARRGLAVVYDRSDAVYGEMDPKEKLDAIVARARARKIGMWSRGKKAFESPAAYKRRTSG